MLGKLVRIGAVGLALGAGCSERAAGAERVQPAPAAGIELRLPAGPMDIEDSLREAGGRCGKVVVLDEALRGKQIELFTPARLDRDTLVAVLDHYGIRLVEEKIEGRPILKVYLERCLGLPCRFSHGNCAVLFGSSRDAEPPVEPTFATALHAVGAGDGRALEALVLACMKADPARCGRATYVASSRTLVITDLAPRLPDRVAMAFAHDVAPAPGR